MLATIPHAPIYETGIKELVGKDEQIDQNDFSGSVTLEVDQDTGQACSGEFLSVMLMTLESGSGAILQPTGQLILFDEDPNPTSGDTALTAAEWKTAIGYVDVEAGDWIADANGALAFKEIAIPFHDLQNVYAVWLHTLSTSINSAAGDDEELHCNLWFRKDS